MRITAILVSVIVLFAAVVGGQDIFFLGDSLSDNGNGYAATVKLALQTNEVFSFGTFLPVRNFRISESPTQARLQAAYTLCVTQVITKGIGKFSHFAFPMARVWESDKLMGDACIRQTHDYCKVSILPPWVMFTACGRLKLQHMCRPIHKRHTMRGGGQMVLSGLRLLHSSWE